MLYQGEALNGLDGWIWGSNSKVFTGTLLALGNILGSIAFDTPVTALLPSDIKINLHDENPILLWHLATHSAGWPDGLCIPKGGTKHDGDYPFSDMAKFLHDFTPSYDPGQQWNYSNQGFALLGNITSVSPG